MNLERLNPEQKDAVLTTEGPLLIFAGAGSGKTNVLVHRIAYLIEHCGVSPHNILAITFTNKAANEMRDRIIDMIGEKGRYLWARTFHSAFLQILRFEVEHTDLKPNFVIYDTADQLALIKRLLKEYSVDPDDLKPGTVLGCASKIKQRYYDVQEGIDVYREEKLYPDLTLQIIEEYQKNLATNNAIDFDDILCYAVKLFKEHPDILERYQRRFKYILVDEYQDTNMMQYELVNLLAAKYRNICVVGDDDQSIYEWRGADISNILSFEKDYPEARVVKLEKNYRSTQMILNLANSVIANNTIRKNKKLWTENELGDKVIYHEADDDRDEAQYIVDQIEKLMREDGYDYKDFAILIRTNAQFRSLEEGLLKNGIPYRVYGGMKFFQRREIKDILAYLYVIANPDDAVSMQRIINVPKRGVGAQTWQKILGHQNTYPSPSLLDSLTAPTLNVSTKVKRALFGFTSFIEEAKEIAEKNNMSDLVSFVINDSGYLNYIYEKDPIGAEADEENLNELISIAAAFDMDDIEDEKRNLTGFLESIALYTDLDQDKNEREEDNDKVSVMTMHSSKGLEFPVVFIAGFEKNLFPHGLAKATNGMEEERRLCYVAFTRAKKKLYIIRADHRLLRGHITSNDLSEFFFEMDDRYYKSDSENFSVSDVLPSLKNMFSSSKKESLAEPETIFNVGDKISHKKWGPGVVVSVDPDDPMDVKVAFENGSLKELNMRYAPAEKIL